MENTKILSNKGFWFGPIVNTPAPDVLDGSLTVRNARPAVAGAVRARALLRGWRSISLSSGFLRQLVGPVDAQLLRRLRCR